MKSTSSCIVVMVIIALIPVSAIGLLWCAINFGWTTHVATLDCGGRRTVEIRTPVWWEYTCPLDYMVREKRRDLLPNSSNFDYVSPDVGTESLSFSVLKSADGDCIAVTEDANPEIVLILHDFSRDWSWPYDWDTPQDEYGRRVDTMLAEIQENVPEAELVLRNEVVYSIGIKEE
ncbi:hypothetical protein ACFL34_05580 [Candidatus Sumerlaeota bacterium]